MADRSFFKLINIILTFFCNEQIINVDFYNEMFAQKYKKTVIDFSLNKSLCI